MTKSREIFLVEVRPRQLFSRYLYSTGFSNFLPCLTRSASYISDQRRSTDGDKLHASYIMPPDGERRQHTTGDILFLQSSHRVVG